MQAKPGNHPLALRMALIAFALQNVTMATLWGSFSLMLPSVEARLGISREQSSFAIPLLSIVVAGLAPVIGARMHSASLRTLTFVGAGLSAAGYLLLGTTQGYAPYLVAHALLLAPGMCICGVLMPATLVTRWFTVNRGRALGLVHTALLMIVVPLVTSWLLNHATGTAIYLCFAALTTFALFPAAWLIRDWPPEVADDAAPHEGPLPELSVAGTPAVLRDRGFWAIALGSAALVAGSVALSTHLVPMVMSKGLSSIQAASLISVQSIVAIPGAALAGWLADRIGGIRTLALVVLGCALLWSCLLLDLPYPALMLVVGLFGLHAAGSIPLLSMALSEVFGRANFSRPLGLANMVSLPFQIICTMGAAYAVTRAGSYSPMMIGMIVFCAAIVPFTFSARSHNRAAPINLAPAL